MNKNNTMNEEADYLGQTKEKVRQYINKRILLIRLQAADKFSRMAAVLITVTAISIIAVFLLIFGSITAAYWLADITGSLIAGFGIVALFYFVVFLLAIFFLKKILQKFFVNMFIKLFHKKD